MKTAFFTSIGSFWGAIGTLQAILFILGLVLLIVEMFLPGFGIAGGFGIALLIVAIIMTAQTPLQAFVLVLFLILLISLIVIVILRSAKKGELSKKLILKLASKLEDGYRATSDNTALIGKEGIALSLLRPSGMGEFDGQRLDVVSEGSYIESGAKIKIVQTEGIRIVVKKIE